MRVCEEIGEQKLVAGGVWATTVTCEGWQWLPIPNSGL